LSYGEAHRVALAAALAPRPRLLLLDEPFSGLDFGLRARLLRILAEVSERQGAAVILASHDAEPYGRWAHQVIRLGAGTHRPDGEPDA
jgi:energy-coupling factor transporter ATP-binding protein EcfA2